MQILVYYTQWDDDDIILLRYLREKPEDMGEAFKMVLEVTKNGFNFEERTSIVFIPSHRIVEVRIER